MHTSAVTSARTIVLEKSRTSRAVIALMLPILVATSCQPLEQGYWKKPGQSEAAQSAEYRQDSEECARQGVEQVAMNKTFEGDTIVVKPSASAAGSTHYSQCMASRGYEWIKLQPLVPPLPHRETTNLAPCPSERVVLDPFGYPHCAIGIPSPQDGSVNVQHETPLPDPVPAPPAVPIGTVLPKEGIAQDEALRKQVPAQPPLRDDNAGPHTESPPAERREFDNSLCIQHSRQSLSNPYDTYLRCMEEKGWPPLPR